MNPAEGGKTAKTRPSFLGLLRLYAASFWFQPSKTGASPLHARRELGRVSARPTHRPAAHPSERAESGDVLYQAERDAIMKLATNHDAARIPGVAAYPRHADESVRDTAGNGLIRIDDAKAVPCLNAGVSKARAPEGAIDLSASAAFLVPPNNQVVPR